MDKFYYVIESLLDPKENGSYSLMNDKTGENVATLVVQNEDVVLYFADRTKEEFGPHLDKALDKIRSLNLKFMKLSGDHRWKTYNPNPQERNIGDCTLRSYCAAFNIDWDEAFDIASKIAKENSSMIQYVADKVLVEHFGCRLDEEYKKNRKEKSVTVNEFAMTHPYGTYILCVRSHQVTVRNGEYWDSWDSGDKKVNKIYLID